MTRVAVFLSNGFEEMEAVIPIDIWRRAGYEVITISISKNYEVTGSHNIIIKADSIFSEESNFDYDVFFLPGGMPGTSNLANSDFVLNQLIKAHNHGKHLVAICAAPLVFGRLGFLDNKSATCFPGYEHELKGAKLSVLDIVTDGNITTGRGAGVAFEFALEVVKQFSGIEVSESLRSKIQMAK